jgi:hypothetical protein
MANLALSIRSRLLNIATKERLSFQDLLNRFGAEQFLARLAASPLNYSTAYQIQRETTSWRRFFGTGVST